MAKTKTSSTVKNRYNVKAYDQLPIRVVKGKKELIQAYAAAMGESLNGFVNRAIDEAMAQDIKTATTNNTDTQPTMEQPQRQSFGDFLKTLPESEIQTRTRMDLFMQFIDSRG